jgi:hypothetical protein
MFLYCGCFSEYFSSRNANLAQDYIRLLKNFNITVGEKRQNMSFKKNKNLSGFRRKVIRKAVGLGILGHKFK